MPFVYLISAVGTEYVKVGRSMSFPAKRVADMQTANPHELRLLAWTEGAYEYEEERLHSKYQLFRVRGEWFIFSWSLLEEFDQVVGRVATCQSCQDRFIAARPSQIFCSRACTLEAEMRNPPRFTPTRFGAPFT